MHYSPLFSLFVYGFPSSHQETNPSTSNDISQPMINLVSRNKSQKQPQDVLNKIAVRLQLYLKRDSGTGVFIDHLPVTASRNWANLQTYFKWSYNYNSVEVSGYLWLKSTDLYFIHSLRKYTWNKNIFKAAPE